MYVLLKGRDNIEMRATGNTAVPLCIGEPITTCYKLQIYAKQNQKAYQIIRQTTNCSRESEPTDGSTLNVSISLLHVKSVNLQHKQIFVYMTAGLMKRNSLNRSLNINWRYESRNKALMSKANYIYTDTFSPLSQQRRYRKRRRATRSTIIREIAKACQGSLS